jgi:signal peptidase I
MSRINPQDLESQQIKADRQQDNALWRPRKGLIILIVLGSIGSALAILASITERRHMTSSSMMPTLLVNDRLIVDKIAYHFNKPQRGDIVVFYLPIDACVVKAILPNGQTIPNSSIEPNPTNTKSKDVSLKRIVGIPGDRIEVKNAQVFRNDELLQESYIAQPPEYDLDPITVPENQYLVFGDNRNNSCDSHIWGFVPRDNIIGKAVVRFWPLDRLGGLESSSAYADNLKK